MSQRQAVSRQYLEARIIFDATRYLCWVRLLEGEAPQWYYAEVPRTMTLSSVWETQVPQAHTWAKVPDSVTRPGGGPGQV